MGTTFHLNSVRNSNSDQVARLEGRRPHRSFVPGVQKVGNAPWNKKRSAARQHYDLAMPSLECRAEGEGSEKGSMDVSAAVVNPVYRSKPWSEVGRQDGKVHIVFVSESNVCRSVLAEAIFSQMIEEMDMKQVLSCESKGTRDYNVGDGPDRSVVEASEDLGIMLPAGFQARVLDHARDIVAYDLFLVMDKFTAADVLREVSVFDTISKEGNYSMKVRRLGEFHPVMAKNKDPEGQDIDDPLYGNIGGSEEVEAVKQAAKSIEASCLGLMQFLQGLYEQTGDDPEKFRSSVVEQVRSMEDIDWLVPPMLQKKQ